MLFRSELRKKLTGMQFKVTQDSFTEPAFKNAYWNHHDAGIYVDIVSGEPLFASTEKFDSGTGWPSFVKPLVTDYLVYREDRSENTVRMEVRNTTKAAPFIRRDYRSGWSLA